MTGLYGTTAGPVWECNDYGGSYEGARFGEVAYLLSCPKAAFEATAANAKAISQVPAMLALVDAVADWVNIEDVRDMARAIVKELEKK